MVRAQGGDARVVDDPGALPSAAETSTLRAERPGTVVGVQPSRLGYGITELGGGRKRLGDPIDPSVGFLLHVPVGQEVVSGEPLATVHAASRAGAELGLRILRDAIRLASDGEDVAALRPLVSHRVLDGSVQRL
jgi:thymidine phosphorylase